MLSKLVRLLLCTVLLLGLFAAVTYATVNLESGKVGIRISNGGSIRFVVPSNAGTRQIERINIIAALNEKAVCDYNEDHDAGELASYQVATPRKANVEGYVKFDSRYSNLPPNLKFNLYTFMWTDQPYVIARYTIINDSSEQVTLHLGAVAVPRIGGNYGGETNKYDAASQLAYSYRGTEAAYAGIRLLSHTPYSYKDLDWSVYSPADPAADAATDSTRFHQTADPGFDAEMVAGGDGSIYSLNAGSFSIAPHDSVIITYGIVYGGTFDEMVAAATAMQANYSAKIADVVTTNLESGKIGIRLSNAGSIRFIVPDLAGTRQIERVNIIAALSEKAVCDYNEDHNPLEGTVMLAFPAKSDIEGSVNFDSRYANLPPNLFFNTHTYMWTDQPYVIAEYTVTNDSAEAATLFLGAVAVPRINGNYGGETNKYDAASQTAYCYREGEAGYAGVRLLSHAPYSFKTLDWGIYSPDDPNADAATDSIRYHQTADGGFDADMVAGGDGSIYSLNAGSFAIPAHGSITIAYGVVFGDSFADMVAASNAMQARYAEKFTAVEIKPEGKLPTSYALSQNWPNPFNPTTSIQFDLLETSEVRLSVYNLRGQLVNTIASGVYQAGSHQVIWNGKDAAGRDAAAGIYLYRLRAGKQNWTRKMTLVR
jgi:hypothetical protein